MSRLPGVPPNIALQTGPMLLGNLFGYGLYGILIVQMFLYYHSFPNDRIQLKALVWMAFLIDTIITVFATIAAWNGLAKGWGDLSTLAPLDWPFTGMPLLSALVASMVHFFFAWRIWKLQQTPIISIGICLISLLSLAMASYCGIHGRQLGLVHIIDLKPYVIIWLGGSTLVDVVITMAMVNILMHARNTSSFLHTTSAISRLITITVETGMTTAVGALTELILFIVFSDNNLHFLVFLMLAKLYSNTLMATLNSRASFHDKRTTAKPALWGDESSRSTESSGGTNVGKFHARTPMHGTVQVSTVTERREDIEMFPVDIKGSHETKQTTLV